MALTKILRREITYIQLWSQAAYDASLLRKKKVKLAQGGFSSDIRANICIALHTHGLAPLCRRLGDREFVLSVLKEELTRCFTEKLDWVWSCYHPFTVTNYLSMESLFDEDGDDGVLVEA